MNKDQIQAELTKIEAAMSSPDFWNDKDLAQAQIKRMQELKDMQDGVGKYDKGNAVMTLFAGAGGNDSEDFVRMLYEMYLKFIDNRGWKTILLNDHPTDQGGYRNVSIEIMGKGVYGQLKHESGVHRLVRISPFNAQQKRHTSFAMVEVAPVLEDIPVDFEIPADDLKVELSRSSGPGGQNVNKRETAVRIVHLPTNISVSVESERSQERNREKAMELLRGKLYQCLEEQRQAEEQGLYVSKTTDNEWGSQIRSYVLHPYKMIKDHRTGVEVSDVDKVLQRGEIDEFISAMQAEENSLE
jgi:peptide chain release factor 2